MKTIMDNYILNSKHIKLIKIDSKINLFFHSETMQIYPIYDKELLNILELFEKQGEIGVLKYYSKENINSVKRTISEKLISAPKSILYVSNKNQPPEYNTVVLPIAADCNLYCPYCFAQTDRRFHFGNYTNKDIVRTLEFVVKENKSHNLSDYNKDILLSIRKQFELLLEYYVKKFRNKENIYNKRLFDYLDILRYRTGMGVACGAGRSYFTITANGDIFTCPHFMNDLQYCIGNIETELSENKEYTSVNITDILECKDCWAKFHCAGNCLAQKISTGKSNDTALIPEICELEKITFEFYIKLFYYAKKHIPEYFKNSS